MKILVISIPGIGNTLLAVPMLKELRNGYPKAKIDLLVGLTGSAKIMVESPYVNKIYFINKKFQKNLLKNLLTIVKLRNKKYDVIITTIPSAQPHYNLLASFIYAKKRITHNYKRNLVLLQNYRIPIKICHDVEQNLNLLEPLSIKSKKEQRLELWLTKEEKQFANKFIRKFKGKTLIGIHPGTSIERGMIEKRWPLKNFAVVVDWIIENKRNSHIFVFLGPEDKALGKIKELIKRKNKGKLTIIEDLNIKKVASIIEKCKFFISNDSGLMHVAVSLGVPTAGIFVSTDYRRTAPYGKRNLTIKEGETYKSFRQSIEEISGINTNWQKNKIKQPSVEKVINEIKKKLI